MIDLESAEIALGRARAAFEVKPFRTDAYLRLIECEARFLRAENRVLRKALSNLQRTFRKRQKGGRQ